MLGPLDVRYATYAGDINRSATHLLTVISDILDLSRAEAGLIETRIAPVKLPEVVDMTLRLVEQRASIAGLKLERDLDRTLYETAIDSDQGKLTQVLLNLLSNSVKFTKPGGLIKLTADLRPDTVEISVSDTGIGIAPEDLETVMTPFGQVQSAFHTREGFGLGLPLSKKLVESLGGKLLLDSKPGIGTTVTILLPRAQAEELPQAA